MMQKETTTPKKTLSELAEEYEENVRILDEQIQRRKELMKQYNPYSTRAADLSVDIAMLKEMRTEQIFLAKYLKNYYKK